MTGVGKSRSYRDLEVWKRSIALVKDIYEATSQFPPAENFGLVQQIRRAAVSIPSNIAEGQFRNSTKEFKQFLNISKGSNGEVRSMYYTAEDQKYVTPEIANDRRKKTEILRLKITNFMFYLKK